METRTQKRIICLLIMALLILFVAGCSKNTGVQGGDFEAHTSLFESFFEEGNTTITLEEDEVLDMTEVGITGRKEIILNDHRLTLTGSYRVNEQAVLDIKSGEGRTEGVLDLNQLTFDLEDAPLEYFDILAVIEIQPAIQVIEPVLDDRMEIRDFPNLTVLGVVYSD